MQGAPIDGSGLDGAPRIAGHSPLCSMQYCNAGRSINVFNTLRLMNVLNNYIGFQGSRDFVVCCALTRNLPHMQLY